MQGPLAAVVLLLELTHRSDALMVPILLAVVEATVLARLLGAPSIYSARVSATPQEVEAAGKPDSDGHGLALQWHDEQELRAPSDLLPESMRERGGAARPESP